MASDAIPVPQILPRAMQESDLAAVLALETRSYAFPWTEGIFRDCLRVGYFCSVLEIDYLLAGYGVISSGAGEAHLLNLCVREEFRCRGLGRRLLEHLLDLVSHSGARLVFLEVRPGNTAAIRLYETMFFQQIGMRRGYYQAEGGREDALVMRRDLTV
ncbi:MAG: ribosomal protein S18-alanine N-acetyltransferase [Steroidobacteraceae bacterium]